jgi:hypothetical protein
MWVRKGDRETAAKHPRVWMCLRGPAVVFLFGFLAMVGGGVEGPRTSVEAWPQSFSEILYCAAVFATAAAIAVYVLQLILRRPLDLVGMLFAGHVKVVICNSCYRVKERDAATKCECGGTFEDFDRWTWVEDEEGE